VTETLKLGLCSLNHDVVSLRLGIIHHHEICFPTVRAAIRRLKKAENKGRWFFGFLCNMTAPMHGDIWGGHWAPVRFQITLHNVSHGENLTCASVVICSRVRRKHKTRDAPKEHQIQRVMYVCVGFCMQCLISISLPARKLLNADLWPMCVRIFWVICNLHFLCGCLRTPPSMAQYSE
jgi:hypothetical protein